MNSLPFVRYSVWSSVCSLPVLPFATSLFVCPSTSYKFSFFCQGVADYFPNVPVFSANWIPKTIGFVPRIEIFPKLEGQVFWLVHLCLTSLVDCLDVQQKYMYSLLLWVSISRDELALIFTAFRHIAKGRYKISPRPPKRKTGMTTLHLIDQW